MILIKIEKNLGTHLISDVKFNYFQVYLKNSASSSNALQSIPVGLNTRYLCEQLWLEI